MHARNTSLIHRLLLGFFVALGGASASNAQTAFTYQGVLRDAGNLSNGSVDFEFRAFDALSGGAQIGSTQVVSDIAVSNGVFTVTLDFGAVYATGSRFLDIRVANSTGAGPSVAHTALSPRQPMLSVPIATTVPDGAINSAKIADESVTAVDIAVDAVGALELQNNAVDTSAVQNLAITQPKIADAAVGSAQVAPAAIGLAQINTSQVQSRISGACPFGEYVFGVNADGSLACEPVEPAQTVDDPSNDVGSFTSIAIGNDGLPVISYVDNTANNLKVAKCTNAACVGAVTITAVDVGAQSVRFTSIAIGLDGFPVISYNVTGVLRVVKCANAACTGVSTRTTVDGGTGNNVGQYSSIAIGSDGLPVISYYDATAAALRVAKCANAACTGAATITTVDDPANTVGPYTSIAIGSDTLPVISYFDFTAMALKVAKCANAACTGAATITTVDDPVNDVGQYTSIAIGSDGLPVMSYYDATAFTLKVAKCANAA